ncbi:hypothetical protein C7I36_13265 [Zobellella taiwanensis]|uniref:Uncharacterized protein n=1 Tax=Zobellella taiwanensis TaxID=347535 RepID=A0A2P7QMF8_9GAMM|nr:hypothetical protein C7I36_13265 [Zobellella taiwanensis]
MPVISSWIKDWGGCNGDEQSTVIELLVIIRLQLITGKRIKWLILPLHESETDRHLIGLSG